ncbi:MAG: formylglycine-generating enzyme family protein [Clostridiaceae bacterium]|jgi:formylglycine-generating enzyme required for sulfatase activity|nr:formylglycine-generating enzyme family protein [Clostridiaceae bacterium]
MAGKKNKDLDANKKKKPKIKNKEMDSGTLLHTGVETITPIKANVPVDIQPERPNLGDDFSPKTPIGETPPYDLPKDKRSSDWEKYLSEKTDMIIAKSADNSWLQPARYCPPYSQMSTAYIDNLTAEEVWQYIFGNKAENDIILLFGEHGIGNSTVISQIFNMALEKTRQNKSVKIIPIYIHCNRLHNELRVNENKKSNYTDTEIDDVICKLASSAETEYDVNNFVNRLYIFDGFHHSDMEVYEWIKKQIKEKQYGTLNVVITTSDDRVREKIVSGNNYGIVKIGTINKHRMHEKNVAQCLHEKEEVKVTQISLDHLEKSIPVYLRLPYFLNVFNKSSTEILKRFIKSKNEGDIEFPSNMFEVMRIVIEAKIKALELSRLQEEQLEKIAHLIYTNSLTAKNSNVLKEVKDICDIDCEQGILRSNGGHTEFRDKFIFAFFWARHRFNTFICPNDKKLRNKQVNQMNADTSGSFLIASCLADIKNSKENNGSRAFLKQMLEDKSAILARCMLAIDDYGEYKDELIKKLKTNVGSDLDKSVRAEYGELLGLLGDRGHLNTLRERELEKTREYLIPQFKDFSENLKIAVCPVTVVEYKKFVNHCDYRKEIVYAYEEIGGRKFKPNGDECDRKDSDIKAKLEMIHKELADCAVTKWKMIHAKLKSAKYEEVLRLQTSSFSKLQLYYFCDDQYMSEIETILRDRYSLSSMVRPLKWKDPDYNNPNFPIVGVNYFEACAYCNWLNKVVTEKGIWKFRLLNAAEWENFYKETYPSLHDNLYSTDSALSLNKINIKSDGDKHVLETVSLRSTDGYDLAGNIFEMIGDERWDIKYDNLEDAYVELIKHRICLGGSFLQPKELLVDDKGNLYKGQSSAFQRNVDIGFRICMEKEENR